MKLDRERGTLLLLSLLPLLIGSVIVLSVLDSSLIGEIVGGSYSFTPVQLATQAVVSTALGLVVVLALFWVVQRTGRGAKRFIVAFLVSPILGFVSVFLGQVLLLVLFKGSRYLMQGVVLFLSVGVSMISVVLVMIDVIPPLLRNVFVAFYGSIFGTFLGMTMVTSSMIVLIASIIVEDYLLIRYSPATQTEQVIDQMESDPFDYTRIKSGLVSIGVGDYVVYSLIATHSLVFFPPHVSVMALTLAGLGIFINAAVIARPGQALPAIPLPALLGVFPWLIHITALAVYAA
jgi:hypothetical protein